MQVTAPEFMVLHCIKSIRYQMQPVVFGNQVIQYFNRIRKQFFLKRQPFEELGRH